MATLTKIASIQSPAASRVIHLHPAPLKRPLTALEKLAATGKLILPTLRGVEYVRFDDILYLKAHSNYTEVYTRQRKLIFSQTLKAVEMQLPEEFFMRVHRSYIVNLFYVKAYVAGSENAHLLLDNDVAVPLSRAIKSGFRLS